VYADFHEVDIATSLKYKEVANGDTFTFAGAATRVTATGTAGDTYAYLESYYSGHGVINVTAAKGSAWANIEGSTVASNAVYDMEYEIQSLKGAAVNINGGFGANLGLYNSIVGNVTLNAGNGEAFITADNTFISSQITNRDGSFTFGAGTLKVSGQTANVAMHNAYLSTLDLTAVKGSSTIELKYDNTLLNDYGFSTNPDKFDIKLKVNKIQDNIEIYSDDRSDVIASISGFEWGTDSINGSMSYLENKPYYVELVGKNKIEIVFFAMG
jgi:hypothetical protein